jgi:hypothetical protein
LVRNSCSYLTSSGKSHLSPGETSKKGKGSDNGSVKADTITHMLDRFVQGEKKLIESFERLGDLVVEKRAYVTRQLSKRAREMLQVCLSLLKLTTKHNKIKLFDREEMWKNVWPAEVKVYATDVNIEWITKV